MRNRNGDLGVLSVADHPPHVASPELPSLEQHSHLLDQQTLVRRLWAVAAPSPSRAVRRPLAIVSDSVSVDIQLVQIRRVGTIVVAVDRVAENARVIPGDSVQVAVFENLVAIDVWVARVAQTIAVEIALIGVVKVQAVVAEVPDAVRVPIRLVGIRCERAGVQSILCPVPVRVGA